MFHQKAHRDVQDSRTVLNVFTQLRLSWTFTKIEETFHAGVGPSVFLVSANGRPSGRACSFLQFTMKGHPFMYLSAFPHMLKWNLSSPAIHMWSVSSERARSQCRSLVTRFVGSMPTVKCFSFTSRGQRWYQLNGLRAAWHKGVGGHWRVYFGSVPPTLSYSFRVGFPIAGLSRGAVCQVTHAVGFRVLPGCGAIQFSLKPDTKVEA